MNLHVHATVRQNLQMSKLSVQNVFMVATAWMH